MYVYCFVEMTNTNKDFSSQSFVRLHQQTFIKNGGCSKQLIYTADAVESTEIAGGTVIN
jgi:hypothetical protein